MQSVDFQIPRQLGGGGPFLNDWARALGKQRRIPTDRGGAGLSGEFRSEMSHVFGRQMIRAPTQSPHQNGLDGRSVRSLAPAARNIIHATDAKCPSQEVLTQAAIAENHVPRAKTGIPPALAMTGQCDVFAGRAFTAFNRDPKIADSLFRVMNTMSSVMNARNALIFNDANGAIRKMLSLTSPGPPYCFLRNQ